MAGNAPAPDVPPALLAGLTQNAPTTPFGSDFDPFANSVTAFLRKQTLYLRQQTAGALSGKADGAAYVYVGGKRGTKTTPMGSASPNNPGVTLFQVEKTGQHYRSLSDLMNEFESMNFDEKKHMGKLLMMAGYGNRPNVGQSFDEALSTWTLADYEQAYGNLLGDAAARFAAGKNVTPQELLEQNIRFNLANAGVSVNGDFDKKTQEAWWKALNKSDNEPLKPGDPGYSGSVTTKSRHVDIYSPEDTKGLVRAVLQQELGRDPTQGEMEDFSAALTHAMRSNPTTSKTTDVYQDGRVVSSNTVTHQGINATGLQEVATERAQSQPDWAEFQAAGNYLPLVFQALDAGVPGT